MKNNKNELNILSWLKFSEEDFDSARVLLDEGIYNQVCFHSQQAAEKILKAFLKSKGILPPKIHNLLELLEICKSKDNSFEVLQESCEYLGRFYIPSRYPDALPGSLPEGLPNSDDAKKAFQSSGDILEFVKKKLNRENICR